MEVIGPDGTPFVRCMRRSAQSGGVFRREAVADGDDGDVSLDAALAADCVADAVVYRTLGWSFSSAIKPSTDTELLHAYFAHGAPPLFWGLQANVS